MIELVDEKTAVVDLTITASDVSRLSCRQFFAKHTVCGFLGRYIINLFSSGDEESNQLAGRVQLDSSRLRELPRRTGEAS